MKIHIVQKGDTLFLLAKSYEIELADLIKSNPQLSNPDMLMPGMKITIPTRKQQINLVENEKKQAKAEPMKRPIAKMEADDHKARRIEEQNLPLYPVELISEEVKIQEKIQAKAERIQKHDKQRKVEEIAYTREEGGMRELPVEERPLMTPPQHRLEFSICCHCNQPIYQQQQD